MLDPNGFVARLAACLNSWGILLTETSEPDMYRLYYQRDSQESLAYLPNHRLAIYAKLDNGDGMSYWRSIFSRRSRSTLQHI